MSKISNLMNSIMFKGNKNNSLKTTEEVQAVLIEHMQKQGISFTTYPDHIDFEYEQCVYQAALEIEGGYPTCGIHCAISDSSYLRLNNASRSIAINSYNAQGDCAIKLTAHEECVSFITQFFFADRKMFIELFMQHVKNIHTTKEDFVKKFIDGQLIPKSNERATIGFLSSLYRENAA